MSRPRAVVSWSTGKDCAWALHEVRTVGTVEVVGLLSTVSETFGRVSIHGVRVEVAEAQAEALGVPLYRVPIPYPCPNEVYERAMGAATARLRDDGVERIVFGDLFLEDIRRYRELRLDGSGLAPVFPLWGRPTAALAETMIRAGVVARIVSLDPARVPRELAGRVLDRRTLAALPPGVDPCGENGEFHTCVTDGPMFAHPIPAVAGPVVERDGFVYADLALAPGGDDPTPAAPSP
jgi:uncharacterized protein (TIGR00290 family)